MRSDPLDVATALRIGRGTLPKMHQNLGWAIGCDVIALPRKRLRLPEPVDAVTARPQPVPAIG